MSPSPRILNFVLLVCVLGLWQLLGAQPEFQYYFADPLSILRVLLTDSSSGTLPRAALLTGQEAAAGLAIGLSIGTVSGFMLWYAPLLGELSRPWLLALGALPIFSFAPLVIVWFGIGFGMKVAVAALGVGLLALCQAFEGANQFSKEREKLFMLLGATRTQMLVKAVIPSSIDWVFNSVRLCVNTAILGAFIGEFISSSDGIGHYMNTNGSLYNVPAVFAGGLYLIALSSLLHGTVGLIARKKVALQRLLSVPRSVR